MTILRLIRAEISLALMARHSDASRTPGHPSLLPSQFAGARSSRRMPLFLWTRICVLHPLGQASRQEP